MNYYYLQPYETRRNPSLMSSPEDKDREIYLKCPKCGSLYSTTKTLLESDRYIKSSITSPFLGAGMSPLAQTPKCAKCSTRLERITPEEFQREMDKPSKQTP